MKHMNDVEKRLEQAAKEVRQVARHSVPPPIEEKGRSVPGGWLVFAATFVAVVLAIGVLPLLSRSGDEDPAGDPSPTTTVGATPTSVSEAPATTTPVEAGDCSAAGLPRPAAQEGLPTPVAEARRAIAAAAIACDYAALEALSAPNFITSFGGGGFDNLPRWEEEGTDQPLATLVKIFDTPFATQDIEGNPRFYVWPSAFVYETWDEIPAADLNALLEIYTQEELDQIAGFGAYAGWRIGITETGEWRFFVAGD